MATPKSGRGWHARSALLFVALALVVLGTFDRYGLNADESTWHIYGTDLVSFYASAGADRTFVELSRP